MNSPVENIVQHLFKTDSLDNVSTGQLQQLINDYPYFDAAYFLLAKKLFKGKEPGYEKTIQQAALHFSNDLWLQFMLNEEQIHSNTVLVNEQTGTLSAEKELPAEVTTEDQPNISTEKISSEINESGESKHTVETEFSSDDENGEIDSIDENYNEADFPVNEKLSNILKEQAAALEKPVEANAELPIETTPYHRVDYFDSQGIKLEEDKANDKLGTQLRRFTDWLKQMKKNGPEPASLSNDVEGEIKVQHMAESSNEQQETVTETMAEVLANQGKPEQAIEIYEKLSFINPSKSAYFAAKIEELKG